MIQTVLGRFSVQRKLCSTCIYKKTTPLDLKKLEDEIRDRYDGFLNYRACHHAQSGKVCCRGFWNKHRDKFALGQIAQRLGLVAFVDVDDLK